MDKMNDATQNDELAKKLWEKSIEWVKLEKQYSI